MSDTETIPSGFHPFQITAGFGAQFGMLYVNEAECKLAFRVGPQHLNPSGICHGGAIATFIDTQIVAIRHLLADSKQFPAINLAADYIAPAKSRDWVEATVTVLKTTKTMVFVQSLVQTADGPIARGSGIYRDYDPRAVRG